MAKTKKVNTTKKVSTAKKQDNKDTSKRKKILLGVLIPVGVLAAGGIATAIILNAKGCSKKTSTTMEEWLKHYKTSRSSFEATITSHEAALYKSWSAHGTEGSESIDGLTIEYNNLTTATDCIAIAIPVGSKNLTSYDFNVPYNTMEGKLNKYKDEGYTIDFTIQSDSFEYTATKGENNKIYEKFDNEAYAISHQEKHEGQEELSVITDNERLEKDFVEFDETYIKTGVHYVKASEYALWKKNFNLTIPAILTYNGESYDVTGISSFGFANCNAKSITFPTDQATFTYIGTGAFKNCTSLTGLTMPATITYIGENILKDSGVDSVTFSTTAKTLYQLGFDNSVTFSTDPKQNATNLKDCDPTSKDNWGLTGLFSENSYGWFKLEDDNESLSLTTDGAGQKDTIYIPSYIKDGEGKIHEVKAIYTYEEESISGFAGSQASMIEFVNPNADVEIGFDAFKECQNIRYFNIPQTSTIEEEAFLGCSNLQYVNIPEGVRNIVLGAFRNCAALETITLPGSIESIGKYVFEGCSGLKTVTFADKAKTKTWYEVENYESKKVKVDISDDPEQNAKNFLNDKEGSSGPDGTNWMLYGIQIEKTATISYYAEDEYLEFDTEASTPEINSIQLNSIFVSGKVRKTGWGYIEIYSEGEVIASSEAQQFKQGETFEDVEIMIDDITWLQISDKKMLTAKFAIASSDVEYDTTFSDNDLVVEKCTDKVWASEGQMTIEITIAPVESPVKGHIAVYYGGDPEWIIATGELGQTISESTKLSVTIGQEHIGVSTRILTVTWVPEA